jgi:hypothetical protein
MLSPMSTYMSISTLTIDDAGPNFFCDRIPITTSCCATTSTPTLNCATLVLSRQLRCQKVLASSEVQDSTHSIQFVRSTPCCSIGKKGTPVSSVNARSRILSSSVNGRVTPSLSIFHLGSEQKKPVWLTAHDETSPKAALTSTLGCLEICE